MSTTRYVVTGVNRLTGLREAISVPCSQWKAELMCMKYRAKRKRQGVHSAYTWVRVEPVTPGLEYVKTI